MRELLLTLLTWGVLLASVAAQSTGNGLAKFAGTWTGTFQDRPLVRVNLVTREGKFSGTVSHPINIKIDDAGEVSEAAAELADSHVVSGVVSGDTLSLTCRESSGEEVRYELTISGTDAELKLLDAAPEFNLKPWKLAREREVVAIR